VVAAGAAGAVVAAGAAGAVVTAGATGAAGVAAGEQEESIIETEINRHKTVKRRDFIISSNLAGS
jgi:hypothetical protein